MVEVEIFHLSLQLARQAEEEMCLLEGRKEMCSVLPKRQGLAQRLRQGGTGDGRDGK